MQSWRAEGSKDGLGYVCLVALNALFDWVDEFSLECDWPLGCCE